jgi:type VI secretion system secreted protein VgrG
MEITDRLRFVSMAVPADFFSVVDIDTRAALSTLFETTLTLISQQKGLDFADILENPASLVLVRQEEDGDVFVNGMLREFAQLKEVNGYVFYRAVLVPKLWRLTLTRHNQVFLDKTVPEILEQTLLDGGLTSKDFEFRLTRSYPKLEYACQYRESHYNLFARWLEREGMYYYFLDERHSTKLIVTDTKLSHKPMAQGKEILFSPTSGLDSMLKREAIESYARVQRAVPASVKLKDYNYRTPALEITAESQATDSGLGLNYEYGDNVKTPSEAKALAKVRAEELLCQQCRYQGHGASPLIRPGYLFQLNGHPDAVFNTEYLTVSVRHRGSQAGYLLAGLGLAGVEDKVFYENDFEAIESSVQFRPERTAPKPRIHGCLNAVIDAEGGDKYAELDEQGRYKVILPFDESGRKDGAASCWLRMMQPYTGADHGMHFPLHKGCEVMLGFVDGDPDRPFILGAVPNPLHPSQIASSTQTMSKVSTAGGNKIHFEDKDGSQRILLQSPSANTWVRMGAPNDPPGIHGIGGIGADAFLSPSVGGANDEPYVKTGADSFKDSGYAISTEGPFEMHVGGIKVEFTAGGLINDIAPVANKFEFTGGASEDILLGGQVEIHVPQKLTFAKTIVDTKLEHLETSVEHIQTHAEDLKINGTNTKLATEVTRVEGLANQAQTGVTNLRADVTTVCGNDVNAYVQRINTAVDNIQANANAINTLGNRVDTVATNVKTVGTVLKDVASEFNQTGTFVHTAGTSVKNAGTIISNGLHLQN